MHQKNAAEDDSAAFLYAHSPAVSIFFRISPDFRYITFTKSPRAFAMIGPSRTAKGVFSMKRQPAASRAHRRGQQRVYFDGRYPYVFADCGGVNKRIKGNGPTGIANCGSAVLYGSYFLGKSTFRLRTEFKNLVLKDFPQ